MFFCQAVKARGAYYAEHARRAIEEEHYYHRVPHAEALRDAGQAHRDALKGPVYYLFFCFVDYFFWIAMILFSTKKVYMPLCVLCICCYSSRTWLTPVNVAHREVGRRDALEHGSGHHAALERRDEALKHARDSRDAHAEARRAQRLLSE